MARVYIRRITYPVLCLSKCDIQVTSSSSRQFTRLASALRRRMRPGFQGSHDQLPLPSADGLTRLPAARFGYELSFCVDHRNPRLLSRLAEKRGDLRRLHERRLLRDGVSSGAAEDHVGTRCPHDMEPVVVGVG